MAAMAHLGHSGDNLYIRLWNWCAALIAHLDPCEPWPNSHGIQSECDLVVLGACLLAEGCWCATADQCNRNQQQDDQPVPIHRNPLWSVLP
jgi:hypothetical protein